MVVYVGNSQAQDLILFDPNYVGCPFDYYYSGGLERGSVPLEKSIPEEGWENLKNNYSRIWIIHSYSSVSHPTDIIEKQLSGDYLLEEKQGFPGLEGYITVSLYAKK